MYFNYYYQINHFNRLSTFYLQFEALIENVLKGGIRLEESPRYKLPNPWDKERPEKPWEHY